MDAYFLDAATSIHLRSEYVGKSFLKILVCNSSTTSLTMLFVTSDFFADTIASAVVGTGYGCFCPYFKIISIAKEKHPSFDGCLLFGCSNNLSSRTVASQVLSALVSLTTVFGMRTGGTSPLTSPQWYISDFSVYIFFKCISIIHSF